ncbi:MAG TPA: sigma factor-like helix-turn-helix DNA-binding protein [Thermoleophilaceae bacterium]|nr:sigma factor-like helix-turn-helix DNA-binding protein [Thermoleophilaceae bacterium]
MARGELAVAAETWDQLAVNNFDRIKQTVNVFRFSAASGGIPEFDRGSAASAAYLRVRAMGANFRKQEIEAYYAALVHTVQNSCMDFGRREFRHTKRKAGSLDQRFDAQSETGPYDAALASWEAERRRQSAEDIADELHKQSTENFVAWGISQIKNDNYQEVLELTYVKKLEADEIAERLGISMANVYARRSRGLRELGEILREHGS